jgi:PTH1 family peptidyl-tRNA hydrolase
MTSGAAAACAAAARPAAAASAAAAAAARGAPTTTATTTTRRPRSLLQRLLGAGRRTGDAVLSAAARAGLFCAAAGPTTAAPAGRRRTAASAAAAARSASSSSSAAASGATTNNAGPWLIVGLGNPGPRYDHTRHNVGFAVVDALAAAEGIDMKKLDRGSGAVLGSGAVAGRHPVLLAKPMTFMNVSGEAVGRIVRQRGIPPARVLVVSDDLDSPLGRVRLRSKGGHGGHNGLRSIVQHLGGTHDFPRLKVGIGRPPPEGPVGVAEYVLQRFAPAERAEIDGAVSECLRAIDALLEHGVERAMSGVR